MGAPLLFLAFISSIGLAGVIFVKLKTQKKRDRSRESYLITFSGDLDVRRVVALLRSLSGTLRSKHGVLGQPSIAFELRARKSTIEWRLRLPWTHAQYVASQLQTLIKKVNVRKEDGPPPRREWTKAVELGLSKPSRTLNIHDPNDVSHAILATLRYLGEDEEVIIQFVVMPAAPEKLPGKQSVSNDFSWGSLIRNTTAASADEINERRAKLQEPNFLAVQRIAAVAAT